MHALDALRAGEQNAVAVRGAPNLCILAAGSKRPECVILNEPHHILLSPGKYLLLAYVQRDMWLLLPT